MKKIAFYLAHPAHFHLFKNVIEQLKEKNKVYVVYNHKDVLEDLINNSTFKDLAIKIKTNKKINNKFSLLIQFVLKNIGAFITFLKIKPQIVLGTPILISLVGRFLPYKSVIVNEDDFDIVKRTADFGYPYANHILCPSVCRTTNFDFKSIKYNGYHELAYLHPNNFKPSKDIALKYVNANEIFFIIRFAKLVAHHDVNVSGLNIEVSKKIIELLLPFGEVFITSEVQLHKDLEKYRININPIDIHHVMAYAQLFIGDSQTMAAESGVMGVPFIRFNDFVGRIGYLDELENKYKLGYGIKTNETDKLIKTVEELLSMPNRNEIFQKRREAMLNDKIDYATFLTWFVENYPESAKIMKENPDYQYRFK